MSYDHPEEVLRVMDSEAQQPEYKIQARLTVNVSAERDIIPQLAHVVLNPSFKHLDLQVSTALPLE